jgi:hypothetical protein
MNEDTNSVSRKEGVVAAGRRSLVRKKNDKAIVRRRLIDGAV